MKKKILLLINLILMLGVFAYLIVSPGKSERISCPVANQQEAEEMLASCVPTQENILTDLRFNQVTLPQDVKTGTFYLPLNLSEEQWETGELTSGQADVRILFRDSVVGMDKAEALAKGTEFEFWAFRGDEYRTYSLVFTGLPMISIETDGTPESEMFGGMIYFWEADTKKDWAYSNILEAHIRGNTSRIYPKKGYKLTLKKERNGVAVEDKRALFGLREDDEFILNAMYTDASKIRDALCADIWSGMGASVETYRDMYLGTRMTYVEVLFNGEYWGLYGLMEPIDSKQLDLAKERDGGIVEYAYKSSSPQLIETEEWMDSEIFTEEMAGYKLKGTYSQITKETWQPLFTYLQWKKADDGTFVSEAERVVNPDNMMKIWVYLQAVLGIDNRAKNMYYAAKYEDDAYRMYLAPWDMDLTLGDTLQESDGEYPWTVGGNSLIYRERINFEPGDRMVKLNAAEARDRVVKIWSSARETVLDEAALCTAVDHYRSLVADSGAAGRDGMRWPESMQDADYEKMKLMLCYRMQLLDLYFYDDPEAYLELGYS